MPALLHQYVTRQAELRPAAVAVAMGDRRLTYAELDQASTRLARRLCEAGCAPGDRICLFLPKSPEAIVSMLGVLKAGAVYVPIDLASPAARAARIVEACQPWGVLAADSATKLLDEVLATITAGTPVVGSVERHALAGKHFASQIDASQLDSGPLEPLDREIAADDPAHILFTSGSTGIPKGVVITHRNVTAFVDWGRDYFGIDASDRVSNHAPLHFDLSTFDIYGALSAGAALHLVPPTLNLLPHKLADFIRANELTQWFSVPSILTFLAKHEAVAQGDFPKLKRLMWCGEVLPTPSLIHFMQRLPHVTFTNLYGPTEATIASSFYTVPECPRDDRAAIPIGTACPGEELLVLDANRDELPAGETGDLYIRGVGLSPGYWQDPEKTNAAFVLRPPVAHASSVPVPADRIYKTGDLARRGDDGLIYFLGRADTQIKSRGYRIELGEIESAFQSVPDLQECAIVALPTDGFEGHVICCAYVPQPDSQATPPRLRQHAAKLLPSYMLPLRWRAFDCLPKNANGKIDRPRLRELFEHDTATGA